MKLYNILKCSSYFKQNKTRLHYKDQLVPLLKKKIAVYSVNRIKAINTLCGQNSELLTVNVSDMYSYDCALQR
jgi:hypothetical protein